MSWGRRSGPGPRTGYRGANAPTESVARRALRGGVLAALVWVLLARLGVHDVIGIAELRGVPIAVVVGALLGWAGWLTPVWLLASVATLVLLVVTTTPVMRPAVAALLARDAHADAAGADAVFVMSSAVTDDGLLAGQGPERLLHGLALVRASGLPLVVSTVRRGPSGVSSLDDQRALAGLAGVDRLTVFDSVGSTRDEAVRLAATARARGWRRVAVVTSPLHARRACATVARTGLAVRCVPSPSRELGLDGPTPLSGTEARARAFGLWAYEWVGWWTYRARGWV